MKWHEMEVLIGEGEQDEEGLGGRREEIERDGER